MSHKTLNTKMLDAVTSQGKPQADHFDALCPGLAIRVTAAGKKTWNFVYTSPRDGKRARITLGTYPATDLKDARTRAGEARELIEAGKDPRDVVAAQKPVEKTIADLIEDRLKMEVRGRNRSAKDTERRFVKNVIPIVGAMKVSDFQVKHLNQVLDPIRDRGALTEARAVFFEMRTLFNFAIQRGEIPYSPIAMAKKPAGNDPRTRYLTLDEIVTVWAALPEVVRHSKHVPTILRLCLVTGQRLSEVAGMTRREVDLQKRLWTIPAARVKNKHEQTVPLSDLALRLIGEAMRRTNGDILFPHKTGEKPIPHTSVDHIIQYAQTPTEALPLGKFGIPKWNPHDLRRTAATQMSRRENGLGIQQLVISHVLNHRSATKASITQGVYDQNDFLDEKREALDKWAAFLERLTASDKVVRFDSARTA